MFTIQNQTQKSPSTCVAVLIYCISTPSNATDVAAANTPPTHQRHSSQQHQYQKALIHNTMLTHTAHIREITFPGTDKVAATHQHNT